jgi:hypothetical protein
LDIKLKRGGVKMKIDENVWGFFQNHLGYTDEEMKTFKEDPKNEEILSKSVELMNKTIVVEVIASHGCNYKSGAIQ